MTFATRESASRRQRLTNRRGPIVLGCLAILVPMVACHAGASASSAANSASGAASGAKVQALLEKARRNLVFVQGGSFQMGDIGPIASPEKLPYTSAQNNKPLHKVTLDSFSMSAYKTTYADIDVYTDATAQPMIGVDKSTLRFRYPDAAAGLDWQHARAYCQWLGAMLDLPMDLPTEAQWEYAARNRGQMVSFATDNGKVEPGRNVWEYQQRLDYIEKAHLNDYSPSLPLGQFPATPLGLRDMMTDGYEWMLDWYGADYYQASPERNPAGPSAGTERVLRSTAGSSGAALSFGDGMTFTRFHRKPSPPSVSLWTGKVEPGLNMTPDTTARCVVNSPSEVR